jgi:hypothetical protein
MAQAPQDPEEMEDDDDLLGKLLHPHVLHKLRAKPTRVCHAGIRAEDMPEEDQVTVFVSLANLCLVRKACIVLLCLPSFLP